MPLCPFPGRKHSCCPFVAVEDILVLERKQFALLRLRCDLALDLDCNFLKTRLIILWIKDPSRRMGFDWLCARFLGERGGFFWSNRTVSSAFDVVANNPFEIRIWDDFWKFK